MIRSAYRFYGVLALASVALGVFLLIRQGLTFGEGLPAYLVAINLVTLVGYGYDKLIAGTGMPRVPESLLHTLALLGGSPAALLAQRWFRHKTLKSTFRAVFWLIVVLQILVLLALSIHGLPY
jgi:uncharacterized membrane protein YsdA (DUF1294 family)